MVLVALISSTLFVKLYVMLHHFYSLHLYTHGDFVNHSSKIKISMSFFDSYLIMCHINNVLGYSRLKYVQEECLGFQ